MPFTYQNCSQRNTDLWLWVKASFQSSVVIGTFCHIAAALVSSAAHLSGFPRPNLQKTKLPRQSFAMEEQQAGMEHLHSQQGQLEGIGRCQARQQPSLVGQICDDELLVKLWPHAGISDGYGQGSLGPIHSPLGNQYTTSCQAAHLQAIHCLPDH